MHCTVYYLLISHNQKAISEEMNNVYILYIFFLMLDLIYGFNIGCDVNIFVVYVYTHCVYMGWACAMC